MTMEQIQATTKPPNRAKIISTGNKLEGLNIVRSAPASPNGSTVLNTVVVGRSWPPKSCTHNSNSTAQEETHCHPHPHVTHNVHQEHSHAKCSTKSDIPSDGCWHMQPSAAHPPNETQSRRVQLGSTSRHSKWRTGTPSGLQSWTQPTIPSDQPNLTSTRHNSYYYNTHRHCTKLHSIQRH